MIMVVERVAVAGVEVDLEVISDIAGFAEVIDALVVSPGGGVGDCELRCLLMIGGA